jgi:hypothetical protein
MKSKLLVFLYFTLFASSLLAWIRPDISDAEAVAHAQIIVIGRIKENSLVKTTPDHHTAGGITATATLQITEVLKGPFLVAELPIEIAHGLSPSIGGEMCYRNQQTGQEYPDENVAIGEIKIYDTGNSRLSDTPITGDLNKDQIWLLRANYNGEASTDRKLRIWDPEDIQPLSKKKVLMALIDESDSRRDSQKKSVEQVGTGQPATRSESKSEGGDKTQPESEGRSR